MTGAFMKFLESMQSHNPFLIEAVMRAVECLMESDGDSDADYGNQEAGDGNEKVIAVSKLLGFDVDVKGNKMSCEFTVPIEKGIDMAPKTLEDIKRKMAKVGLGFNYSINPIGEISETKGDITTKKMKYRVDALFTAPTYAKDGYEYLMTMEKSDSGTFVFPSENHRGDDFSKYYESGTNGFVCDHCRSDRLRNVMHVFRKDGKDYTYGTSCAKKYFGINFLDKISRAIYFMFNEFERFSSEGGSGVSGISPSYLFGFAFGYFKLYPFYQKQGDTTPGTRNEVMYLFDRTNDSKGHDRVTSAIPSDISEKYNEFKKYYVSLDAKGEFENNLAVMANTDNVKNREGLFLYAVYNWMKTTGDVPSNKPTQNEEPKAPSEYAGSIGDKLLFPVVKVLKIIPTDTQYGTSYIHIMESLTDTMSIDAAKALVKNGGSIPNAPGGKNDSLVWFASSMSELKEGETYALTGTVTKHNIRSDRKSGDVKQTVIKLVKVADLNTKSKATGAAKKNELSDLITRMEPVIGPKITEVVDNIMKYSDEWMKRVVNDYFMRTYKKFPFEVITDTPDDVVKAIFTPALRKRISDAVNDYGIVDKCRGNGIGQDVDYKKLVAACVMMLTSAMDKHNDTLIDQCRSYVVSNIAASTDNYNRNRNS